VVGLLLVFVGVVFGFVVTKGWGVFFGGLGFFWGCGALGCVVGNGVGKKDQDTQT